MAEQIRSLTEIDWIVVIVAIFVLLETIKAMMDLLGWFGKKIGVKFSWIEKNEQESKTIQETAETINVLKEQRICDIQNSIVHDKKIEQRIDVLEESLNDVATKAQFICDSLKSINTNQTMTREALIEMLYQTIHHKCNKYIDEFKGIPADELEDFVRLKENYTACGGNHGLQQKVQYCLDNLPILPSDKNMTSK